MLVEVIPLTDFVHGRINASQGKPIEIEESMAKELERHSLVRIRLVHTKPALPKGESGKALGDGKGQPSSASPVAPASPTKMLRSSDDGKTKTQKVGA